MSSPDPALHSDRLERVRARTNVFLTELLRNRATLGDDALLEIDEQELRLQAELILDQHGAEIVNLGTRAIFDLIVVRGSEALDVAAYEGVLSQLGDLALAVEVEATAGRIAGAAQIVRDRRELTAALLESSELVVRGVLWAALGVALGPELSLLAQAATAPAAPPA